MRKWMPFVLTIVCIVALAVCASQLLPEKTATVLEEPPALTVSAGERTVAARLGTYSWHSERARGGSLGVTSDSIHPLAAKAWMTPLEVAGTETVSLDFAVAPDAVTVRAWDAGLLVQDVQKTDETPADISPEDDAQAVSLTVSGSAQDGWTLILLPQPAVYEISAEWTRNSDYGGEAFYSFYTQLQP